MPCHTAKDANVVLVTLEWNRLSTSLQPLVRFSMLGSHSWSSEDELFRFWPRGLSSSANLRTNFHFEWDSKNRWISSISFCSVLCCRCEDMVDVRRLKMLQMVQLFKCEEDALQVGRARTTHTTTFNNIPVLITFWAVCVQAVEWLGELLDALLKTHVRLGDESQETRTMLDKHRKFVDVAQVRHFLTNSSHFIYC